MALIPMLAHAADVSIHQLPIIKQIAIDHLHQGTHLLGKVHNGAQIYLVDTTITPEQYQEKLKNFGGNTPMGRPGQPAELGSIYVQLAANDASFATGQIYASSGGAGQP